MNQELLRDGFTIIKNFFTEVLKMIKEKRFYFYYERMRHDVIFRTNLNKKII